MKTKHNEIEITYDERTNKWLFELRGRSRIAESLTQAKEIIDTPQREKKESSFKRKPIWLLGNWLNSGPFEAEATSLADKDTQVWIMSGDGSKTSRSKVALLRCVDRSPENDAKIAEWRKLEAEKKKLEAAQKKIITSLKPMSIT